MPYDIWNGLTDNIIEYALSAYDGMGDMVYPILFVALIGYVFAATQSIVTTVVAIIITFASFGTVVWIWEGIPQVSVFFYIVTVVGLACLVVGLILKLSRTE